MNPETRPFDVNLSTSTSHLSQQKNLNMEQQHIDSLLERYLNLIDEYSRLREELSKLQAGVFQNIARANFTGERGMRYGQDHYDERMRALRVLDIAPGGDDVPTFTIKSLKSPVDDEGQKEEEKPNPEDEQSLEDQGEEKEKEEEIKTKKTTNNPLRWFSILAPAPLRTAQTLSIQAVEQVIPRLISVNAEMEHVEIEIRRARKKRAKAAAAAVAEKEAVGMEAVEAS
ncbi:hypothetical protein T069G_06636 [Trichoderma breve]|uniref:Vacuolar ATPase assembly protein VMA22 n=1 Tax=Trichoderma breve TaxID=2034170 RepID=A0A9W9BBM4_9HYPO|nr:hypothetical protein T069G_06636 [Trichoderma breve]KAJ4858369.1 hypothetical protein T069G_06636 [Trichoderma breve]